MEEYFNRKLEKKESIDERVKKIVGRGIDIKYLSLDDKKIILDNRLCEVNSFGNPLGSEVLMRYFEKKSAAEKQSQNYTLSAAPTSV